MRLAKEFGLKSFLKVFYCTFVEPILEYSTVIWNPNTAENACQLERVQHRFFWFTSYFLPIVCPSHNYYSVTSFLGLIPLDDQRRFFGNKFLKSFVSGDIDSPTTFSLNNFNVFQHSSRYISTFYIIFSNTNYLSNEPIRRTMSHANTDPPFLICKCYTLYKTHVYVLCLFLYFNLVYLTVYVTLCFSSTYNCINGLTCIFHNK